MFSAKSHRVPKSGRHFGGCVGKACIEAPVASHHGAVRQRLHQQRLHSTIGKQYDLCSLPAGGEAGNTGEWCSK